MSGGEKRQKKKNALSLATPDLSSLKFDLIFLPILGYFPTEMKKIVIAAYDWSGSNLALPSVILHFTAHLICHTADENDTSFMGKRKTC